MLSYHTFSFCQVGESSDLSYGLKLYEDKIYDVAITQFKIFLEEHPSSISAPKANYYLAQAFTELNDKENALRFLQKLILNYPKSEYCEKSLIETAQMLEQQQDFDKAARYYLQVKNYFPKSTNIPENSYRAIHIFFNNKKYEEARENIALLKRNYPVNPFTLKSQIILSMIYAQDGEILAAERNYRDITRIAKTPEVKSAILYNFGLLLLNQNKITEAKETFLKVIKQFQNEKNNYYPALIEYTRIMMDEKKFSKLNTLLPNNFRYNPFNLRLFFCTKQMKTFNCQKCKSN